EKNLAPLGGRPALGCAMSRLVGSPDDPAPTFVDIMQGRPLVRDSARPGYLGPAFKPFRPDISAMFHRELEESMKGELTNKGMNHQTSLELNLDLQGGRLDNRRSLLAQFDRLRRDVDRSGMMDAMDQFSQQAVGILTSGRLAAALDLAAEDPRVVESYTAPGDENRERFFTAEGPRATQKFLLARRLVEAGVRCVSVSLSDFDTHSANFPRMRELVPIFDHGLCALVRDLEQRGLLDDVVIVAWGEFGRSPTVNKNGGRDHWPSVGPAILAGGGLRVGQVIGETDRLAAQAKSRAVTYKDIFATLYHSLGVDARRTTIRDVRGRPQYLLDEGEPLRELV
ncbi:MAG: DUF1501 domain-containing protein, partial [Planctomycetales bacterium]|nr:DUF1501 domain-containing protein [Planctomycetales bacterium]